MGGGVLGKWVDNGIYTPELPRRVLDVGTDNLPIRLHQPHKNEKAQYATLSLVLGERRTAAHNNHFQPLGDHMLAVPHGMPKQYQMPFRCVESSVSVILRGPCSFCIIQHHEARSWTKLPKTGSVYRNSTQQSVW